VRHASPTIAKHEHDLATLRQIVDERLWGLTSVVRHAAPRMQQGSITFTSGSLSSRPRPGTAILAAVEALAPALALELAPVRVNAVTWGLIDTPPPHRLLRGAGHDRPEPGRHLARETRGHRGRGGADDPHDDDQ
jgi:NAD(P)-dependent dehydrogenase (short-subunit alcohol dehydrogenase family)